MTGIPFKKVKVHKGIISNGEFVEPNIRSANNYSQKVIGKALDRSIWNIQPAERYIAPENFYEQLLDRNKGRINWEHEIQPNEFIGLGSPAISTLPMNVALKLISKLDFPSEYPVAAEFNFSPITVKRWRIAACDVYQTIYYPDTGDHLYRASITGDLLIAEYINPLNLDIDDSVLHCPSNDFGFSSDLCLEIPDNNRRQKYGKIAPIDDAWRKQFQWMLTSRLNIYSLGRFATWRNILLDDLCNDITTIRAMMNAGGGYDLNKAVSKINSEKNV